MKKIGFGILGGMVAGIIDVIPMILQKLTWDANVSAFVMWIVVGFFIAVTDVKIHPAVKGMLIAFLVLLPSAILIGWSEPFSLLPIALMTSILGALLGLLIPRFAKNRS